MQNKKKPYNFEKLEDDFKKRREFVLYLGTGINYSKEFNFSWDNLIEILLQHAVSMMPYKFNMDDLSREKKTNIIKQTIGENAYLKVIQHFLYKNYTHDLIEKTCENYVNHITNNNNPPDNFLTLFRIADLILHSPNINEIVTQNYDQFLEDAMLSLQKNDKYKKYIQKKYSDETFQRIEAIKPITICNWKPNPITKNDINIYHVHGFIPKYEAIQAPPKGNHVVLSPDEFYEDSKNVYSWQAATQMHFLTHYCGLICGLSLEDFTSQRLLHYVKNIRKGNLYYITAPGKDTEKEKTKQKIINIMHTKNGLSVIYDDNYDFYEIYKLIGDL